MGLGRFGKTDGWDTPKNPPERGVPVGGVLSGLVFIYHMTVGSLSQAARKVVSAVAKRNLFSAERCPLHARQYRYIRSEERRFPDGSGQLGKRVKVDHYKCDQCHRGVVKTRVLK